MQIIQRIKTRKKDVRCVRRIWLSEVVRSRNCYLNSRERLGELQRILFGEFDPVGMGKKLSVLSEWECRNYHRDMMGL